ncbi:MAG TPA: FKBP-type peptidyl-prolyl cis-trans isomerase [Nocardioidaceae bacterium]|nr:FKBP-type peptidyl-prolyl cis-trans isomerase [Nocardioidaceae bacterium]
MRRRLIALTVVPLLLFGTAACGDDTGAGKKAGGDDTIAGVEVAGDFGKAPEVTIDEPLKLDETQTQVIQTGDGNPVVEGQKALLNLDLVNGTTGKEAFSTFTQGTPYPLEQVSEKAFFPAVVKAIVDQPVGSRIAVAAVPEDGFGKAGNPQMKIGAKDNVVFVVDIVSVEPTEVLDGPEGEKAADLPKAAPTVTEKDGAVTKLSFANAPKKPSDKLQVIPLIEGDGPEVRDDSLVSFDYLGQVYGSDTVFDESYTKEPVAFPVGIGGLIKAWDESLVGVKRGSRLLIIAPPELGYGEQGSPPKIPGNATLAFVVDILGVDEPA